MSATGTSITLTSIHCVNTSEAGHDEVYVKYSIDGGREQRYPASGYQSMEDGDSWSMSLPITFKNSAVVSLFDSDTLGDEFLGSHTYYPTDPQPEVVEVSNTNGAEYTLSTSPAN
jgi:hypothetical protein